MNILITSVGRRSYMIDYFKDSLAQRGKVFAANNQLTYALTCADEYILTPNIYDNGYVDFLLNYCRSNKINAIISLFDIDLPVLAKNKSTFEKHDIKLIISDEYIIDICNDKWKTFLFLKDNGFDTPLSFIEYKTAKQAIEKGDLSFPVFMKPRWGMGSIGIYEADNFEELKVFYQKIKNTIQKTYLKYESQIEIEKSIIIQEKLDGQEWGIDIFNDLNGNNLTCIPKLKEAMRAGETDIAETKKDQEIIEMGKRVASYTKHIGNLDLDFFRVGSKNYILEMNCRFGGQYPFSHLSGTDFPKVLIDLLDGKKPDPKDLTFEETKGFKDFDIRKM